MSKINKMKWKLNQLILLWNVKQFVLSLSVSLKIWTMKVSIVLEMSSNLQTSPTFKLLSFANAFHPVVSSNFRPLVHILIEYVADQTLPFNTWSWISPLFLFKSKCVLQNKDGIFCQTIENANVDEWKKRRIGIRFYHDVILLDYFL